MFRSVSIEGYRGFARYQMHDLGRVNLLVGRNNSGKTTVLEALYLLGTGGDPVGLWDNCIRRGEIFRDPRIPESRLEADVSHLFHGHDLTVNSGISVTPDADKGEGLSIRVDERGSRPRDEDFAVEATEAPPCREPSFAIDSSGQRWTYCESKRSRRPGVRCGLDVQSNGAASGSEVDPAGSVCFYPGRFNSRSCTVMG